MSASTQLSIVSPVYQAEGLVSELVARLLAVCAELKLSHEIILVEDGSTDQSWQVIESLCRQHKEVKAIRLSRNFGQHYAISAGLQHAAGEQVIVIDCDLEDDPQHIAQLLAKAREGFEIVYTESEQPRPPFPGRLLLRFLLWVLRRLGGTGIQSARGWQLNNFTLMSRRVVQQFNGIHDYHRNFIYVLHLLGFPSTRIRVNRAARLEGRNTLTVADLLLNNLSAITTQNIKLLSLSTGLGFLFFAASVLGIITLVVLYFVRGALPGYSSLMVLLLFSMGLILFSVGILGIYLGKTFEQIKDRPVFIVEKTVNLGDRKSS